MALFTEDIIITEQDGWTAIVLTGTVIYITEIRQNRLMYRFGISSLSNGAILENGESITIAETIYVKPFDNKNQVKITVTKD